MKILVANFKAELNLSQISKWLADFKSQFRYKGSNQLILCPPAIYLSLFKAELTNLPIFLGSQDISQFEAGKFTGELTAKMVKDYADYVLIGHSERRRYLAESKEAIQSKITQANLQGLKVILCVENPEVYQGQLFALAYEPLSAIGTGVPEDSRDSFTKVQNLKKSITQANFCLYGGSVNSQNVNDYSKAGFDGVLVGAKSLNVSELIQIFLNL